MKTTKKTTKKAAAKCGDGKGCKCTKKARDEADFVKRFEGKERQYWHCKPPCDEQRTKIFVSIMQKGSPEEFLFTMPAGYMTSTQMEYVGDMCKCILEETFSDCDHVISIHTIAAEKEINAGIAMALTRFLNKLSQASINETELEVEGDSQLSSLLRVMQQITLTLIKLFPNSDES